MKTRSKTELQRELFFPTACNSFDAVEDDVFALAPFFFRAAEQGRLYGLRLDGLWLHVGLPETIAEAEAAIENSEL